MGPSTEMGDRAAAVGLHVARDDRRRRRGRRLRLRRWIVAAGLVCALPGAWALAVRSPLVRARVIDVVGASHVTRARALALAGVSTSTNVARLDAAMAASRLEANPWIADASVEVDLPWTIRIELVERAPVLAVKDGPRHRMVAGDGTLLGEAPRDGAAFPVLRSGPGDVEPAAVRRSTERAAAALAPIAPWGREAIRTVEFARDGSIRFELDEGGEILYGDGSGAIVKARTLVALLRWAESEDEELSSVDLRATGAPTARLVRGRPSRSGRPMPAS